MPCSSRRCFLAGTGRATVLGITGAPGAGKSSLVDLLVTHYRTLGKTIGVVAVDPTSPFSGGALLGDRIRMQGHAGDDGVFIRSLATRGHLGGLSRAAADAVRVMDAMGKDLIIVETVGVGQDEIDIAGLAHCVVVVVVPGMGDDIQAIKAGILEVADIFDVNKADREGADRTVRDLRAMLFRVCGTPRTIGFQPVGRPIGFRPAGRQPTLRPSGSPPSSRRWPSGGKGLSGLLRARRRPSSSSSPSSIAAGGGSCARRTARAPSSWPSCASGSWPRPCADSSTRRGASTMWPGASRAMKPIPGRLPMSWRGESIDAGALDQR